MRVIVSVMLASLLAVPALAQHRRQPERPIDNGPFTPQANRAYMGGGVILEGAPGAPAPPASDVLNLPPTSSPSSRPPPLPRPPPPR